MHCRLFLLLLAAFPIWAIGEGAATEKAIDPASPRGALKAYGDALPAGGITAALAAYHAANDRERAIARSFARTDIAASTLEQMTRRKFGARAGDDVVHAMRLRTDTDIVDALEKITGDDATIEWADGRASLKMIRIDGKWKVPVSALIDPDDKTEDVLKTNNDVADAIEQSVKQLQAGDFPNAYLLERAVKQRMYRILGADDIDD